MAAALSIKLLITVIVTGAAIWMFVEVVRRRLAYLSLGTQTSWKRSKRLRMATLGREMLLHERLLNDMRSGLLHLVYFYGFIMLQLGALDIMLQGLWEIALIPWQPWYGYFSWSQEWIVVAVLLAVALGAIRRYGEKLKRLKRGLKSSIVYWFIGSLMLSVLFTLSFERLLHNDSGLASQYTPVSSSLAAAWSYFGIESGSQAAAVGYEISWWLHLLILLSFLVYVPQSKHFHLIVAPVNLWLRREEPAHRLSTLNLEDEEAERFGAGHIHHFNQKQLLDLYACVECGRCTQVCPAASTGKLLSPMHLIVKLRDHLTEQGAALTSKSPWLPKGIWEKPPWGVGDFSAGAHVMTAAGTAASVKHDERQEAQQQITAMKSSGNASRNASDQHCTDISLTMQKQAERWQWEPQQKLADMSLIGDVITEEELWSCTTCRNCEEQCPVGNEHVDKIVDMRRHLVLMEGSLPSEAKRALQNIERQSNPWGISRSQRGDWIADCYERTGIKVRTMKECADQGTTPSLLLWAGSMASYDNRSRKLLYDLVRLLDHAQQDFAVLGAEELSSGDTARRVGNEMLYQELASQNIETILRYGVSTIVTPCPHTFHTFKNEYIELGLPGEITVLHHSELLERLVAEKQLVPKFQLTEQVTVHDSCYLGRYNGIYDAPRNILSSIPGLQLVEMSRTRENAMCCGAGGGMMWMEEQSGTRVNYARTQQALETNASIISTACPYCLTMLEDGVRALADDRTVATRDFAELLAASVLGEKERGDEIGSRSQN